MKKLKFAGIAVVVFVAFIMIQMIVSGIFAVVDGIIITGEQPGLSMDAYQDLLIEKVMKQSSIITIISDALAILFAFVAFGTGGRKFYQQVGFFKVKPYYIPIMLLMGFAMNIILILLINILPIPDDIIQDYIESSSGIDTDLTFVNLFATAIIAPIAEEIIFRGLIFTRFSKAFGVVAGSIISSVVFGVAHGNVLWAIYAGTFGLLLAWIFYLTKSLFAPICIHMAFNSVGFFIEDVNAILFVGSVVVFCVSFAAVILLSKQNNLNT